jgi:pimeloyl-ACP methyl ester carboxylesterase
MTRHVNVPGKLEQRIHDAESELFAGLGIDVEEFFVELPRTGGRVRVLAHGDGPALLLLHGVSLTSAVWAPLFDAFASFRVLAVDLPGHGLSDPMAFRRGHVREQARWLIDDLLDALKLDQVPVIGHSLGGMFALWHVATGSRRISQLVALGAPAVALPGVRVRMPLSLMTVRGAGRALLRSPTPPALYRRLLAQGFGSAEVAAAPDALINALRLSSRRPANARAVASLMHAIDRFRRPRPESVLTSAELAAIAVPTLFILGDEDPYLRVEDARPSIQQVPGAGLHEMPAGHGPWLVDPASVVRLATDALLAGRPAGASPRPGRAEDALCKG